jgi:hypothetical protein
MPHMPAPVIGKLGATSEMSVSKHGYKSYWLEK